MTIDETLELGAISAPSRVMFGPHVTNLGHGRSFSDRHVAYYARRSVGGAGIVVTETASVHELDWPYERAPLASECGAGWSEIVAACPGSLVVASLGHAGMQGSSAYSQRETWAPSGVPDAVTREMPKVMEASDVDEVLAGFGRAATIAAGAGCAGVEIDAGQHSLVRQFCSGLTNMRSDRWGPNDEGNRLAFLRAVLKTTRDAIPAGSILGLRLSCDELAPWAGITPEAAAAIAAELAPTLDYLVVVRGSIYSADATRPDGHTPAGFNDELASQIRSAVAGACPVFTQGSVIDPNQKHPVEMTRSLIADPDLVAKVRAGQSERIRTCLLCNQKCQVRDSRNPIVSCVVNPSAGHELSEPESAPAASGTVQVVGAGPAGLEAARVCAEAGMNVTVWEEADGPMALVRNWTRATGRQSLATVADWLEAECARLGVRFRYGTRVDLGHAATSGDGAVILATGAQDRRPEYATAERARVVPASQALDAELGDGPVAIWDPVGGPVGISLAETLAADPAGPDVILITPDQIAGTMLSLSGDLAAASTRLAQAGVTIIKRHGLAEVRPDEVVLENRVDGSVLHIPATCLIDAGHRVPGIGLGAEDTTEIGDGTTLVGDAVAPRTLFEAILEGRRAAVAVCREATSA